MELTVKDRINLLNFPYPKQSGLITQVHIREIIRKVEFTPEEIADFELKDVEAGAIEWNPVKSKTKEVQFKEAETVIISDVVNKLDKEGFVSPDNLDTCMKFYRKKENEALNTEPEKPEE